MKNKIYIGINKAEWIEDAFSKIVVLIAKDQENASDLGNANIPFPKIIEIGESDLDSQILLRYEVCASCGKENLRLGDLLKQIKICDLDIKDLEKPRKI